MTQQYEVKEEKATHMHMCRMVVRCENNPAKVQRVKSKTDSPFSWAKYVRWQKIQSWRRYDIYISKNCIFCGMEKSFKRKSFCPPPSPPKMKQNFTLSTEQHLLILVVSSLDQTSVISQKAPIILVNFSIEKLRSRFTIFKIVRSPTS